MSIDRVPRLLVTHGLRIRQPLRFLSGCSAIHAGLGAAPDLFPDPRPALPVLLEHIQDATAAQQDMGRLKGHAATRNAKFSILRTSIESEVTYVQGLIDTSPGLGAVLISAASMKAEGYRGHHKPILAAKNVLPSGSVLLDANAELLDATWRARFYCWRLTLDGGTTFLPLPNTPTGQTTVSGLTPLSTVGFQVAVAVHGQPQGPWTQTVSILVL
jgi:hypothetical protein